MLARGWRRRCPLCGTGGLVGRAGLAGPELVDRCPGCRFRFRRERGYFTGAAALSLLGSLTAFGIVLVGGAAATAPAVPWTLLTVVAVGAMLAVPLLLQSRLALLWVAVDLSLVRPLDAEDLAANDAPAAGERAPEHRPGRDWPRGEAGRPHP